MDALRRGVHTEHPPLSGNYFSLGDRRAAQHVDGTIPRFDGEGPTRLRTPLTSSLHRTSPLLSARLNPAGARSGARSQADRL